MQSQYALLLIGGRPDVDPLVGIALFTASSIFDIAIWS